MDGGRSRVPQSADRRVINGAGSPARPIIEPQQTSAEPPQPVPHVAIPHHNTKKEKLPRRVRLPILIGIVIVILAIIGWFVWSGIKSRDMAIDSSKYQAVFLSNGQVYFGKLQPQNDDYLKLTDIFYLQTQSTDAANTTDLQDMTTTQTSPTIIKLGSEIHGPEGQMIISKNQVLFYENLKPDGRVVKAIEQYKSTN